MPDIIIRKTMKPFLKNHIRFSNCPRAQFCRVLSVLIIFMAFFFSPGGVTQDNESAAPISVRFCIPDEDVYPFFLFSGSDVSGVNFDLISATFSQDALKGTAMELAPRPWKRCDRELASGSVDMVIGSYNKARDAVGIYPDELGYPLVEMVVSTADVCFISNPGEQLTRTRSGMQGQNEFLVGIEAGFSQDHSPEITPTWLVIHNHLEKYRLLELGRVDAIVQVCSMDQYPIDTKAEAFGYTDFVTLTPPYLSNPAYIIFSQAFAQAHPQLAKTILQETQKLDKQQIYARYRSLFTEQSESVQ